MGMAADAAGMDAMMLFMGSQFERCRFPRSSSNFDCAPTVELICKSGERKLRVGMPVLAARYSVKGGVVRRSKYCSGDLFGAEIEGGR